MDFGLLKIRSMLLLICLALPFQIASGQKTDKLIFKVAPLSLLNPYGSNLHLGGEYLIKERLAIEADLAAYIRVFRDGGIKDRIGFKIKPEIRYYLNSRKKETRTFKGFYIANEVFFLTDRYKSGHDFIDFDQVPELIYYAYEKIRRFEIGDNVKIGYQAVTKIRLTFDFYFGAGLEYYNASYDYQITNDRCCRTMMLFENPIYKGFKNSITFGVKFGYII